MSQFTLYGILKGNKPDFHVAMMPQKAKPFYASLVDRFQRSYNPDAIKGMFLCWLLYFIYAYMYGYNFRGLAFDLIDVHFVLHTTPWDIL